MVGGVYRDSRPPSSLSSSSPLPLLVERSPLPLVGFSPPACFPSSSSPPRRGKARGLDDDLDSDGVVPEQQNHNSPPKTTTRRGEDGGKKEVLPQTATRPICASHHRDRDVYNLKNVV